MGDKKCDLSECVYELETLEKYVKSCAKNDMDTDGEMDPELMLLLVRIAQAKIWYLDGKYDFKVDEEDFFYVRNGVDFISKMALFYENRKKERKEYADGLQEQLKKKSEIDERSLRMIREIVFESDAVKNAIEEYKKAMEEAGIPLDPVILWPFEDLPLQEDAH